MRLVLIVLICCSSIVASSQVKRDSLYFFKQSEQGITLPKQAKWFNAQKTFSVFDVSDRLVYIHVWNPFDINCQASVKEVNRLQNEYPFAVFVSVLMPDFSNGMSENDIEALVRQYRLNHPIIVADDLSGLKLKKDQVLPVIKGVRADAQQNGEYTGEEGIEELELVLAGFTKEQLKVLKVKTIGFNASAKLKNVKQAMNFPQSVAVSEQSGEMYIADAGNNRVLVMGVDGQVIDVIGTGVKGDRDGKWGAAQLNHPAYLELDESKDLLYVTDSWNHKIKVVNIKERTIMSILGNGKRAFQKETRVDSTSGPINFPAGLLLKEGKLLIAMSGFNEIWSLDVSVKSALPLGLGGAQLDQPTDMTMDENGVIYITDASEGRLKRMEKNILTNVNLFPNDSTQNFGGYGGLVSHDKSIYLSQPYLNRIVKLDAGQVEILAGGDAGYANGKNGKSTEFFHPMGMAVWEKELIVADQANQRVRKVKLKKGKTSTIEFSGYEKLFDGVEAFNEGDKIVLDTEIIGRGMNSVYIEFDLGEKYEWLSDGRNQVLMERAGMNKLVSGSPSRGFIETEVPGSEMNLYLSVQVYCTVRNLETNEVLFRPILLIIPFEYDASGKVNHDIKWNPFGDL